MKKICDTDYLYATARLRALEKDMLTRRDLDKMMDAATVEESYKTANDISLHSRLDWRHYEDAIRDMQIRMYQLLDELTGNSDVFDVFRYKYDGYNLKTIIKSQAAGKEPLDSLSALGTVPAEELLRLFREKKLEDQLPRDMVKAANEANEALAKSGDPQMVDILLDRSVLESMSVKAESFNFPFLTEVVQSTIDIENIRTAVRLKRIGKDVQLLERLLACGGKLEKSRLTTAFRESGFGAIKDMLFVTDYYNYFAPLFDDMDEKTPLTAFERGADNYLIRLIQNSRMVAFGLEPLIAYLLAKENEAKEIRIILASKIAGVSKEKISERLRETYA